MAIDTRSDAARPHPAWLYAGLLAFVPHLLAVLYTAAQRPDYSHRMQYLSELGERGGLNAAVANHLGILPTGLLLMVFGIGLVRRFRGVRAMQIVGALVALHGVCRAMASVFVCDTGCRPAVPSVSQWLHNGSAILGFVALTVAAFTGAAWLLRQRRGWPIVTASYALAIVAVVSQSLLMMQHGGPIGLYQRLALGALQLWVALLALHLLRRERPALRPSQAPVGA